MTLSCLCRTWDLKHRWSREIARPVTLTTARKYGSECQHLQAERVTCQSRIVPSLPLSPTLSQVEEVLPRELLLLRACDGHDDVHDNNGPPNECLTPAQCLGGGPQPLPLHHVPGEAAAAWSLHHEPHLLPVLRARAGNLWEFPHKERSLTTCIQLTRLFFSPLCPVHWRSLLLHSGLQSCKAQIC